MITANGHGYDIQVAELEVRNEPKLTPAKMYALLHEVEGIWTECHGKDMSVVDMGFIITTLTALLSRSMDESPLETHARVGKWVADYQRSGV